LVSNVTLSNFTNVSGVVGPGALRAIACSEPEDARAAIVGMTSGSRSPFAFSGSSIPATGDCDAEKPSTEVASTRGTTDAGSRLDALRGMSLPAFGVRDALMPLMAPAVLAKLA
jgi:hypothetical protein